MFCPQVETVLFLTEKVACPLFIRLLSNGIGKISLKEEKVVKRKKEIYNP